MGNTTSSTIPSFQWNFIRRDENYQIYQNQYGQLAQRHMIPNDPKLDETQEIQSYCYRYSSLDPLVKVFKAEYDDSSDMCSNHKNIEVYTEYIPHRLADTRNLTHQQGLYVMSEALRGFHRLYQQLGPFAVDQTLIGFNQDGRVRVWHSPNFAKNHFERDSLVLMSTSNPMDFDQRMEVNQEQDMVEDIWGAVDTHSIFEYHFRQQMESAEPMNFSTAKQIVDAEIINREGYVPPRLRLEDKYGIRSMAESMYRSSYNQNRNQANSQQLNIRY